MSIYRSEGKEKVMPRPTPFIGRQKELALLERYIKKTIASLIVVTGRRRIGKSRLIEEFAKNHRFLHFSGLPPAAHITGTSQLDEFSRQMSIQTGLPHVSVDDWTDLFILLYEKAQKGRVIILFDEISWMGSKDPDFLGKLKNAWDLYFKKNHELILILCSSVSPWIDKNILSSTGFLGRISYHLTVDELPLVDCNQFWQKGGKLVSPFEKLKVLSVTGGIPRYLEEVDPTASAEENIRNLCFSRGGLLLREFNNIFNDLFSPRNQTYKLIVATLAKGSIEINDICKNLDRASSGFISECLDDLIKSGFLQRDYTWDISKGRVSKLSHFRLSDNYLRFYLKYMQKELSKIEKNEFELGTLTSLPGWDAMIGLQFENLVLANRHHIKQELHLDQTDIIYNNPYFQRTTGRRR